MKGRTPRRVLARAAATLAIAAVAVPFAVPGGTPARAASTSLVISEYRASGPNGPNDEFIEIANISAAPFTVDAGGAGMAIVAGDGVVRCVIPNATVIPRYGHYLCVNPIGYSLGGYPAGDGTTATPDGTYFTDITLTSGIALFNTSLAPDFTLPNRVDAVGPTSEPNPLFREGAGHEPIMPLLVDYSLVRSLSTTSQSDPTPTSPTPGLAQDTDDNAVDFSYINTQGTANGTSQRLGAPGPENLGSPVANGGLTVGLVDPCVSQDSAPNLVRDQTADSGNFSTVGTVQFRRTITNNTGGAVTRLRARITDIRSFPTPLDIADLRARTTTPVTLTVDRSPCGSGTSSLNVQGTTVEMPPDQPFRGAVNTTFDVPAVTAATPLADGASIDVFFLFGVQRAGEHSVNIVLEAITDGAVSPPIVNCLSGNTIDMISQCEPPTAVADTYSTPFETPLGVVGPGVLGNDTDPEGDPFAAALVDDPASGTVVLNPDGSFVYTPNAGFTGTDTFTYQARQATGGLTSALAMVTITVGPPPPTTTTTSTEPPTTTEAPTTAPPSTTPVTPPATIAPTTVAVPELPATGGANGSTVWLAAFLVLLGVGLTGAAAASRRHIRR